MPAKIAMPKFPLHATALAAGGLACLSPYISSPVALLLGAGIALAFGNPYARQTGKFSKVLLALAVAGLGAGMDLTIVAKVGMQGIGATFISIALTLELGYLLARLLKTEKESSILIAVGTAICGGSAIAAVAPAINAKDNSISVALGTVFMLNALALLVFPWAGQLLGLSQHQFGLWSALAIHDTSSVVGATLQYGAEALQTGTTVKLARALWIFPVALAFSYFYSGKGRGKFPWFIIGFIVLSALFSSFPALHDTGEAIAACAKRLMVVTLFLIGTNMTRETLAAAGPRALLLGVSLWVIVAGGTLAAVMFGILK